jgi:hypothetical protein
MLLLRRFCPTQACTTPGAKVWLNAETFTNYRAAVPNKFVYLLGDAKGAKSA